MWSGTYGINNLASTNTTQYEIDNFYNLCYPHKIQKKIQNAEKIVRSKCGAN